MTEKDNLDAILNEIEKNRHQWNTDVADTVDSAEKERKEKVTSFHLSLDLDDEFGEYVPATPAEQDHSDTVEMAPVPTEPEKAPASKQTPSKPSSTKPAKKKRAKMDPRAREMWGCAGSVFYVMLILAVSLILACVVIMAALDVTGINKSSKNIVVSLEENVTASEVAGMLKDCGLIDHEIFFVWYSRLTGDDSEYMPGVYTLSANMGYGNMMDYLRSGPPRTVVNVTVPEGYTVDKIAQLMETSGVCTKKAFYSAVVNGDYSDYAFVASIPAKEGDYADRVYALEGYLFPDTYQFYTGSTGEAAVRKFLDNFDNRVDTTYKTKIAAAGKTLNDVVTMASIVQAEAAADEWSRVARVLQNRMDDPANFPFMESDATLNYIQKLDVTAAGITEIDKIKDAYNTKVRKGLPPGAIGNPGLKAINAVLSPSDEKDVAKCYFFATDSDGNTYYSATYAQHMAICKKYGIGEKTSSKEESDEVRPEEIS